MRGRSWTSERAVVLAFGVVLLLVSALRPPGPPGAGAIPRSLDLAPPAGGAGLVVDPASWQMTGGNSTGLLATWVGVPPGCGLTPQWYHWTLSQPPVSGLLNATSGPAVTFAADGAEPGATTISVEALALLACATGDAALVANASTTVTVVGGLALGNLSVDPAPLLPGQLAILSGSVSGGEPPYTIEVDWGDGVGSATGVRDPGPFSTTHAFATTGTFDPSVTAIDAGGQVVHTADPTTVDVSGDGAIALTPARTIADPGIPVAWNATVEGVPAWAPTDPECDGLPLLALTGPNDTAGTCTFPVPGPATISVDLGPLFGGGDAVASAAISIVPPPRVTVVPPVDPTEIGLPTYLTADVTGGVPPLTLTVTGPDATSPAPLELWADGTVSVPVDPTGIGQLAYVVQVTDAEEVASPAVLVPLLVDPALGASFVDERILNATGANLSLDGAITSGVGPFVWSIVPSAPGAPPSSGVLSGPGEFGWAATYQAEGPVTVRAVVADAAGGFREYAWTTSAIPPLRVTVELPANGTATAGSISLWVGISGGLAPFNVTAGSARGPVDSRSIDSDGSLLWSLAVGASGPIALGVVVRDSTGAQSWANITVVVPAAPTPPPPAPDLAPYAWAAVAVALLVAVLVAARIVTRRTRSSTSAEPVDPTSVLRSILAPADGAERTQVELLAEQEGVPLATARSTLDRLIADGSVRSETDGDGVEVLSWARETPA